MILEKTVSSATRRLLALPAFVVALLVLAACSQTVPRASGGAGQETSTSSAPRSSSVPAPSDDDEEWPEPARGEHDEDYPYVGMWVTEGDRVRQELLPDGRYEEARGSTEKAFTGRYRVVGDDIYYVDDTGFTADGQFRDDVLHHGGMVMRRR